MQSNNKKYTNQIKITAVRQEFDVSATAVDTILEIHLVPATPPKKAQLDNFKLFCPLPNKKHRCQLLQISPGLLQFLDKHVCARLNSLYDQRFILEDKGFVQQSGDGVVLRSGLQHQALISRNFVLLQLLHRPLSYRQPGTDRQYDRFFFFYCQCL